MTHDLQAIARALTEHAEQRVTYTPEQRVRYRSVDTNAAVPGVTTILGTCVAKPALTWWAATCAVDHIRDATADGAPVSETLLQAARRAHNEKRDAGAEKGTMAHDAIHAWLAGSPFETYLPPEPEARNATLAALAWVRHVAPDIIGAEVTVVDPDNAVPQWCGTTDLVALVDGKLSVIDWKSTRKGLFRETPLQLGAYAYSVDRVLEEHGLGWVEQTIAVHVCRETALPKPLVRSRAQWRSDAAAFIAGVHVYRHVRRLDAVVKTANDAEPMGLTGESAA